MDRVRAAVLLAALAALLTTKGAQGKIPDPGPTDATVPGVEDVCWSVTSYWPFQLYANDQKLDFYSMTYEQVMESIEAGARWHPVQWNGQADDTPNITGDGTVIDPYTANWSLVAGPNQTYWHTFEFPWGVGLVQHDAFGDPEYQAGIFWHPIYKQLVIGVDVLSFEPLHYLECNGVIKETKE